MDLITDPIMWAFAFVYFLPSFLAISRKSAAWPICLWVNVFFGWTGIGWFLAAFFAWMPSKQEIAYRKKVKLAKDAFYLREAEKI